MVNKTKTPLGYVTKEREQNLRDNYNYQLGDKSVTISKSAIEGYLRSYFDSEGAHRGYIESASSPQGLQFITNLSFDDEGKTDPNKRKLVLARFLAENTARLPAILIADAGLE